MVDFTTNINKPEIIEILSLLVETLFDIDNLPSIKAYPKSPTGLPTHVLHKSGLNVFNSLLTAATRVRAS